MSDMTEKVFKKLRELTPDELDPTFPPGLAKHLKLRVAGYEAGRSIVLALPISEEVCNGWGAVQPGAFTAAIEMAFDWLAWLSVKRPCVPVHFSFSPMRRPIMVEDEHECAIEARLRAKSGGLLHFEGRAVTLEGKAIATASAIMTPYKIK